MSGCFCECVCGFVFFFVCVCVCVSGFVLLCVCVGFSPLGQFFSFPPSTSEGSLHMSPFMSDSTHTNTHALLHTCTTAHIHNTHGLHVHYCTHKHN